MLNFISMNDIEVLANQDIHDYEKEGFYIVTQTFKWS